MAYPYVNGTLAGSNVAYLFVYVNSVTDGWFVPLFVLSFFLLVLISSLMMQLRLSGRVRFETSFAAASFVTLGIEIILAQLNGIIGAVWIWMTAGVAVISIIWLVFSSD